MSFMPRLVVKQLNLILFITATCSSIGSFTVICGQALGVQLELHVMRSLGLVIGSFICHVAGGGGGGGVV